MRGHINRFFSLSLSLLLLFSIPSWHILYTIYSDYESIYIMPPSTKNQTISRYHDPGLLTRLTSSILYLNYRNTSYIQCTDASLQKKREREDLKRKKSQTMTFPLLLNRLFFLRRCLGKKKVLNGFSFSVYFFFSPFLFISLLFFIWNFIYIFLDIPLNFFLSFFFFYTCLFQWFPLVQLVAPFTCIRADI